MQADSSPKTAGGAPGSAEARGARSELELDHVFLQWFESRLANNGPELPEEHVLDYVVAWALRSCS